ncbi:hypothetical protein OS493_001149 [Desmophyllum pertusum]|uniref:Uncharacterized protein n=1 Tax=Desmophyllum pertusum TaxID=174260 RepID=A0A9W9ZUK6_9CNID|nr:hypothetical protein OS493_001149 [Desmophyllum pertusum]
MGRKYRRSGTLWVYGDSLAVRLFGSPNSRDLCKKLFLKCRNSYNWLYPLTDEWWSRTQNDDLDFMPEKVLEAIRSVLGRPEMQLQDSVLLLNLGLHYPRVLLFSAFATMCQAGFDVIDVYPLTDSYPGGTLEGDVVHYPNKVFVTMETLLEKYKAHNNQRLVTSEGKERFRRCTS